MSNSSNNADIRYAKKDDAVSIEACQTVAFSFPFKRDDITGFINDPLFRIRVLTIEDTVIGHYIVYLREETAELLSLAVDPSYRGQGYGKQLLNDVFALAKENECEYIMLDVRVSNTKAINLYTNAGFKTLATRKDFYQQPREDGFTMMVCMNGQSLI